MILLKERQNWSAPDERKLSFAHSKESKSNASYVKQF